MNSNISVLIQALLEELISSSHADSPIRFSWVPPRCLYDLVLAAARAIADQNGVGSEDPTELLVRAAYPPLPAGYTYVVDGPPGHTNTLVTLRRAWGATHLARWRGGRWCSVDGGAVIEELPGDSWKKEKRDD